MKSIPEALASMAGYDQWILWKLVPATPKPRKIPINPHTLQSYGKGEDWQQRPEMWASAEVALSTLAYLDDSYGIGFIFTQNDPFFFLDIDNCLNPDNTWSPLAVSLMNALPGAAIEVSQSNRGLHIFGTGTIPPHSNKNIALNIELYTKERFVAITATNVIGDSGHDCSGTLPGLALAHFPVKAGVTDATWSTEPVPTWNGIEDDDELLAKAMSSNSSGSVFGDKASFKDLWTADADRLGLSYPDSGDRDYDQSSADQALATHLAYWTGSNCERIERLMMMSALVRPKWETRDDYLHNTILNACSVQTSVYGAPLLTPTADAAGAGKLKATSDAQREYADRLREEKLLTAPPATVEVLAKIPDAKTWIDNQHKTADEIAVMVTPITTVPVADKKQSFMDKLGLQFLGATLQKEMFMGCTYIRDIQKVFTPEFGLLSEKNFDIDFGGNVFQIDDNSGKTTTSAWTAFTQSQLIKWRVAQGECFRPMLDEGDVVEIGKKLYVNTYVPPEIPRTVGDPSLFVNHIAKLLPNGNDKHILMAYLAACVQHKGHKFQWAPIIQGTPGNGKTTITDCLEEAIGIDYFHMPSASELDEKFNSWLFGKLMIGVEDVFVAHHKQEVMEVLKPMITNNRLAKRAMRQDQVTDDVFANFILNTNHKDAIRKTKDDRRFAVFYTAQQSVEDLTRDGMGAKYFSDLKGWLKLEGGYAVVSEYLYTYPIPDELNPTIGSMRAPLTSSTDEAISLSLGHVEQEVLEAIEEGRSGFSGGWVSSVHLALLLKGMRSGGGVPLGKREEMMKSLGYVLHPALVRGRSHTPIHIDGDKKSTLYVKKGHMNVNIKKSMDIVKAYVAAQEQGGGSATGKAKGVFGA